jgi:hypothetical protein
LTCVLLPPLIAVAEAPLFLLKLPAWPVMVCMVSFFLAEQERGKTPHIVSDGALGELDTLRSASGPGPHCRPPCPQTPGRLLTNPGPGGGMLEKEKEGTVLNVRSP